MSGDKLKVLGQIRAQMKLDMIERPIWTKFLAANIEGFDCLLGNNFSHPAGLTIDCQTLTLHGPSVNHVQRGRTFQNSTRGQISPIIKCGLQHVENILGLQPAEEKGLAYLDLGSSE